MSTTQITPYQERALTYAKILEDQKVALEKTLQNSNAAERLVRMMLTCARRKPEIMACSKESIISFILTCAELRLEPGPARGHIHPVPFKSELVPIIGYQGFIDLGYRTGQIEAINCGSVREGDFFDYSLGSRPFVAHRKLEAARLSAPLTHAWCEMRPRDSKTGVLTILTAEEVLAHRKRSRSASKPGGPWDTDEEAMWTKTGVRVNAKLWPTTHNDALLRAMEVEDDFERPAPEFKPPVDPKEVFSGGGASQEAEQEDADYRAKLAGGADSQPPQA